MGWRVWYDNSPAQEFSTEEEWDALPRHGVLIVKGPHSTKHNLWHMGMDYYWMENGNVKSCNRPDIDRYLERPEGLKHVKFGRWADNYKWEAVREEAEKWPS